MTSSRLKKTTYKGFVIESSPFSHRGTRMYEAGIYEAGELLDGAHGKTRDEVIENAQRLIDQHLSGVRVLWNLRPEVIAAS